MPDTLLSDADITLRKARRISFMGLLAIEANPLTAGEAAMFDMFDRERWPDDRCRRYILDQLREPA